jgi:hypothetical protein
MYEVNHNFESLAAALRPSNPNLRKKPTHGNFFVDEFETKQRIVAI